jgi:hypothetical protein
MAELPDKQLHFDKPAGILSKFIGEMIIGSTKPTNSLVVQFTIRALNCIFPCRSGSCFFKLIGGEKMSFPVIKGARYTLAHVPDILLYHGTTQSVDRKKNPNSDYLKKLPGHLRSFEDAVAYPPNQVYIGNLLPDELNNIPKPWYENRVRDASRYGKFGEIIPEDEFYGLMKIADTFELVYLERGFTEELKARFKDNELLSEKEIARLGSGSDIDEIDRLVKEHIAEPLFLAGKLVGCVKRAHDIDENLSAHVILENLATKASSIITLKKLIKDLDIEAGEIDYIIETSEEACGDMNQRGGGNFAKAIGEIAGCINATGCDIRGFCAGPTHGLINAAALVETGIFKNVVVLGGGAVAKLGMNGKDHVAKGMPALEDVLGGFAVLVSQNDGKSPVIRTDLIGKHNVGSGSSPQAVMQAIVADPLERAGLKIPDVDKFSVEMQTPEITEPAGAGNVPLANYKMIAALAVKRGELDRQEMPVFVEKHGMPGFAPTQGHVPSGVPFIGFAKDMILEGRIKRAMIIGKGSLFLGRMTNLFDGVSFIMEPNTGKVEDKAGISKEEIKTMIAEALRELAQKLQ